MDVLLKILTEAGPYVKLAFELGVAVIEAAQNCEIHKTVGEILAERVPDMETIRELETRAREHYARRASVPANPFEVSPEKARVLRTLATTSAPTVTLSRADVLRALES